MIKLAIIFALFIKIAFASHEVNQQNLYLNEVKTLLPQSINVLFNKVDLTFKVLKDQNLRDFACSGDDKKSERIFGFTRKQGLRYKITLNHDILNLFQHDRPLPNCPHGSSKKLALATLIHEMGHVYEFEHHSTSMASFEKVFNFILQGTPDKIIQSVSHKMSPDPYEFYNKREAFTVNLEHFILDRNFKCRRPTVQRYFTTLLGLSETDRSACSQSKVRVGDLSSGIFTLKELDSAKIYQIHYLLAGPGVRTASL